MEGPILRKEKFRKIAEPLTNVSLQPVMSNSLGNYEPKDLPERTGPGEGGNVDMTLN